MDIIEKLCSDFRHGYASLIDMRKEEIMQRLTKTQKLIQKAKKLIESRPVLLSVLVITDSRKEYNAYMWSRDMPYYLSKSEYRMLRKYCRLTIDEIIRSGCYEAERI